MNTGIKAKIHSFESFGGTDGPGLRFVIFMQGCHLQCKYCQNRDTWNTNLGEIYTIPELLNKILRFKNYFDASSGGVTISGGEPLLQVDFIIELFKELKKYNINTAIDTSGIIKLTDRIKKVIELTDIFLLDIKSIDDETCKWITGQSNKLELEFAKYLSDNNKKIWIRQVLLPGVTDKPEHLMKLKKFLDSLNTVDRIDILPYHNLGKFKWENFNQKYPLENHRTATIEDVNKAKKILAID